MAQRELKCGTYLVICSTIIEHKYKYVIGVCLQSIPYIKHRAILATLGLWLCFGLNTLLFQWLTFKHENNWSLKQK